jgi:hypothetical protein
VRILLLTVYVLSSLVLALSYQVLGYQWWYPRVLWAYDTMYLDYQTQRELAMKCKRGVKL